MWPHRVIFPPVPERFRSSIRDILEFDPLQELVAQPTVERFDIAIRPGASRGHRDRFGPHARQPVHQRFTFLGFLGLNGRRSPSPFQSETVSAFAISRSASRSNRATSSAVLRLLMGPSVAHPAERVPFRLDQFLGSSPNETVALAPPKPFALSKPVELVVYASGPNGLRDTTAAPSTATTTAHPAATLSRSCPAAARRSRRWSLPGASGRRPRPPRSSMHTSAEMPWPV